MYVSFDITWFRTATGYFRALGRDCRHAAKNSFVARADGGIRNP
jgi:hypothetical protein